MQYSVNNTYATSFTARCPQIHDADWVNRKVNSFQHTSVTKYKKQILDYAVSRGVLAEGQPIYSLRFISPNNEHNALFFRLYKSFQHFTEKFSLVREGWKGKDYTHAQAASKLIDQYKNCGIASCGEDALFAASVVKLNGIDNVYTACVAKNEDTLLHQICIFNKDNSEFDGVIKPFNTIIVDPWLQKAEFANLLIKDYQNVFRNFTDFEIGDKICLPKKFISKIEMSAYEKSVLLTEHPELTFHAIDREFIQPKPIKK